MSVTAGRSSWSRWAERRSGGRRPGPPPPGPLGIPPPRLHAGDRGDRVQPLAVALAAPVQRVLEGQLHGPRDLAGLAGPDSVAVGLAGGPRLGGHAGQDALVGQVQLGAGEVALDDLEPEVP